MCCTFRQYVVQSDLCVYLSWLLLSLIQCCAISYSVITTLVRLMMMMMMVVTTKYGRDAGSLKNKTHFLNGSRGKLKHRAGHLISICALTHTHMVTHSHKKRVKGSSLNLLSLAVKERVPTLRTSGLCEGGTGRVNPRILSCRLFSCTPTERYKSSILLNLTFARD